MPDPTLGDYAAAGGAGFTALAALAALLTARHGKKAIESAESPRVEVQQLRDTFGYAGLALINTGRGVARGVNFTLHRDGEASAGSVGDGFLRPEEGVRVFAEIGPLPDLDASGRVPGLEAIVAFRDAEGFVHYRTPLGEEYIPKTAIRRRPAYPDRHQVFRRFFPSTDLASARAMRFTTRER